MLETIEMKNRIDDVINKILEFSNGNIISLYAFHGKDFPLFNSIIKTFNKNYKNSKIINKTIDVKNEDIVVVFIPLINNRNIDDVRYEYSSLREINSKAVNITIMKVFFDVKYLTYKNIIAFINENINIYFQQKTA